MSPSEYEAPENVTIQIGNVGSRVTVLVDGRCVLRCFNVRKLQIDDSRSLAGSKYYFAYNECEEDCPVGFIITPVQSFDAYECCYDGHMTRELEELNLLTDDFCEVQEGVFEYNGPIEIGRQWLLDHGFIENEKLLP
jgi:hypothetical protein